MKKMKRDEIRRSYALIGVLGITMLALFMLASIAGAAPYAYITNQGDNTVSIIDTATNNVTATVPVGSGPLGVAVSPNGTKVYVANAYDNATASVIDTATNTTTSTVYVGGTWPYGVAVSPDGTRVYMAKTDSNTVSVIDTATNTVTATVDVDGSPRGVAVSPDGTKVYVTNYDGACVSVIDTATNTVTAIVDVGNYPCGVAVTPDGTKVYVTNAYDDDTVYVIDTVTNTVTATVPVGYRPLGVAVSPDGTKLYVANNGNNTTSVIDTATNTVTATVNVGNAPEGVAVTPDGSKVYVTNYGSNNVSVIDTVTNNVSSEVNVGNRPIAIGQFISPLPVLPVLPVANFSTNLTSGYAPLTVKFTDLSSNATSWKWNFGDGTNSTQRNTTHTYSAARIYTVNLTVSNANGTNSKLGTINVSTKPVLPVAGFSANLTSGYSPLTVQFTDLSKNATSWNWNFGGGATSTDQNTTHTYSAAGIYTVKETVSNADGKDTEIKTNYITVKSPLKVPVADFSASKNTGNAPLTVSFTDKSTGTPTSWKWSFGDGSPLVTKYNPTYTYSKPGTYTVKETVSNTAGKDMEIKTSYITVTSPLKVPVADFSASKNTGNAPLTVSFTDKSTGTPTSWKWSFGDGSPLVTKYNPTYTYSKPGAYTVKETVSNTAGKDTEIKTSYITVTSPLHAPVAAFSASPTSGSAPLKVQFTDKSTVKPTSWKWSFGDGTSSTQKNPAHTYSKAGKYTVSLTVKNTAGSNTQNISYYVTLKK